MSGKAFVDTNIFVYAALKSVDNSPKRRLAVELLNSSLSIVVSTQVLSEFTSVLLRKKIADHDIKSRVEGIAADSVVTAVTLETIRLAWDLRNKHLFSYWDSLIVASAIQTDCTTLYTEDLNHGMVVNKRLHIVNPFN